MHHFITYPNTSNQQTQLGFDVDMLEVQLHELDNVTDKIFVTESTRTHNKGIRKALLWERLQDQPRFKVF